MKKTRNALIMSVFSLLLCISTLLSTTFAWLTDLEASTGNVVQSGNLKAEMYWSDDLNDWEIANGRAMFAHDSWEPGYTDVKYIKIRNAGSLSIKWRISIDAKNELTELANVISVYYVNPVTEAITSLDGMTSAGTLSSVVENRETTYGTLLPEGVVTPGYDTYETVIAIALKMDDFVDTKYQNMSIGEGFEIELVATQLAYEEDSFGDQYDADASHLVTNTYDLRTALANGGLITLGDDIVTDANFLAVPEGVNAVLDLNGYNIDCKANISSNEFVNQIGFDIAENATLTVQGNGKITMTTTGTDIGDEYMSCLFLVRGGNLTLNDGVTVQNKEGVLTNGFVIDVDSDYSATYNVSTFSLLSNTSSAKESVINLNGVTILSYFCAVRIRSSEAVGEDAVNVTVYADNCIITSLWNDPTGETEGHAIWLEASSEANEAECFVFINNCTVEGTVKDELAETGKSNGIYQDGDIYSEIVDANTITVRSNAELKSALVKANNGKTIVLAAGEYTLPQLTETKSSKRVQDITIIGTKYATVNGMDSYKTNNFYGFTFKNITFTGDVKAVFSLNCVFDGCTFLSSGITNQSKVYNSGTLTVVNCKFYDSIETGSLWFQDSTGKVIVENCEFDNAYLAFGKSMNVSINNCTFTNDLSFVVFGKVTVENCSFDESCVIGPSASAIVDAVITLNNCTVNGGKNVKDICYFKGNNNNVLMQFVIDGITYTTDQVNQNIAN